MAKQLQNVGKEFHLIVTLSGIVHLIVHLFSCDYLLPIDTKIIKIARKHSVFELFQAFTAIMARRLNEPQ